MKNYIGYIRVSNKEHENSLPAQRAKLNSFAASKGITLVKIYEEEKSAFGKSDRKVFTEMIEHLKQDDIDGVIFHKVDRSSRNMKDFSLLEDFFDKKDISVIEGDFDTTTAQGRFQFRMFCNMAVWYSENLSEEVRLKMAERRKLGYYPANSPFGYRKGIKGQDTDWKKKYPNHSAKYVREIFELYDTGNYDYASIAKLMREKGVKNCNGGLLTKGMVARIIGNSFYHGLIEWRCQKTDKVSCYDGNHEPIISKELFERAKARREGRLRRKGSTGRSTYSRRIECGCGRFLVHETPTGNNNNRNNEYLRCHNKACEFKSARKDTVEDLIVTELRKYQIKPEFFEKYRSAMEETSTMILEENEQQRGAVNKRLASIEAEMQRIRQGFVQGVFEAEEATRLRRELETEKTTLLKRLDKEGSAMDEAYFKTAQHFLETFQIVADKYKNAEGSVKREVLDLFFSKRVLKDGELLFKANPIVEQVAIVSDLSNG